MSESESNPELTHALHYHLKGDTAMDTRTTPARTPTPAKPSARESEMFSAMRDIDTELDSISGDCSEANWDGYDASPVVPTTIASARRFTKLIGESVFPLPDDVFADPDGYIAFDWRENDYDISICITPEHEILLIALTPKGKVTDEYQFAEGAPIPDGITRILKEAGL